MAVELASGYISLVPSARGFGRSIIREAQSAGSSAGDTASSHFGSRFVGGMGTIGRRAGLALTAGLGAAAFFGVRVAADFEQTKIAFEGILGDVEESNKLLGALRDFAAKTPFEFTGLADSAKNLLAVGFTSEEIIPTMTTLGNVAATLGVGEVEIAGVVRALGQMRGKGKASAEELQQISEQIPGFSAIKAIAEDMGITTAEAFEKMRVGAVPADEAIEAILNGMEDFPGAAGAMERQSKTLNGVISTFKDNLEGMAIDFITPHLPALSTAVTMFSGFLEDVVAPALQTVVDGISNFIDIVGPPVVAFIKDHLLPTVQGLVSDGLQALSDWWDRNGEDILTFFEDLGTAAGDALELLGDWLWETVLPALTEFGGWLIDNEALVVGAIAAITAGMVAYAGAATAAAIANVIALLPFYLVIAAIAILAGLIYYAWQNSELFRTSIGTVAALLLLFGPTIVDFFRDLATWAGSAWDAVGNLVERIKKLLELADKFSVPGSEGPLGFFQELFPEFGNGGVMPGPRGVHSLAWVAGGETVLPTHKTPIPALTAGASGETQINVIGYDKEPPEAALARALNWHRTIQLAVASR